MVPSEDGVTSLSTAWEPPGAIRSNRQMTPLQSDSFTSGTSACTSPSLRPFGSR